MAASAPPPPPPISLHPLPRGESDFSRPATSPASSSPSALGAAWRVGGVVGATAAAGFLEACLLLERRPIPLRFAARYALSNVLPSAVWASASGELVAVASGVPTSALASPHAPPSAARAKQLVLLKSVRCVRQALGSYALAWSLWQVFAAHSEEAGRDAGSEEAGERKVFEKVVRLAPERSSLSGVSRAKHGAHVETLPLSSSVPSRPHASALAVDWRAQGLSRTTPAPHPPCRKCRAEAPPTLLKLVEVELPSDDADALQSARRVLKKAAYDLTDGDELRSVVVLPRRPVAPLSALDAFDVCVNPLAVVLCELATAFELHGATHAMLLSADEAIELTNDLARGLLYQHSVRTRAVSAVDALADASTADSADERFVVIAARSAADGEALARRLVAAGFAARAGVFVVCEESSSGADDDTAATGSRLWRRLVRARTPTRLDTAHVLSLADTGDALLQRVREALRDGHTGAAVQRAVLRTYGPQRALLRRRDALSDVGKCIQS
ncbi:hypothetical protein PybrP1_005662 [[Pythium] brassicae (nom. inval.)]|nr:hypothetical protein PybrP1_005662 [[Pythium] brassicae (nom. inval.)]